MVNTDFSPLRCRPTNHPRTCRRAQVSGAESRGARKELSLPTLCSARTAGGEEAAGAHRDQSLTEGRLSLFAGKGCLQEPVSLEGKNDPEGPGLHDQFSLTCPKAADLSLIKAQKKNTVFRAAGPAGARFWGGLPPWGEATAADSGPTLASHHSRSLTPRLFSSII